MSGRADLPLPQLTADAKDVFVKFWTTMHEAAYRVTEGRVCNRVLGMPVVRLTTVGRRSGLRRTAMLTAPIADRNRVVVVASNGGDARHPQWFHNLGSNPDAVVEVDGRTQPMRARVVDGEERDRLWGEIRRVTPGYAIYQRMTDREIPVVVLEPIAAPT
jgi:deazaflavin-dependent oxidoreductase (nitroreductase family)